MDGWMDGWLRYFPALLLFVVGFLLLRLGNCITSLPHSTTSLSSRILSRRSRKEDRYEMVLITPEQFPEVLQCIKTDARQSTGCSVFIFVAPDADALCACKILTVSPRSNRPCINHSLAHSQHRCLSFSLRRRSSSRMTSCTRSNPWLPMKA